MTRKVIINKLHLETLEDRTTPSTFAEPVALSSVNSILDITFRAHQSTQMIEVKQAGNIFAAGIPTPVDGFLTYAWTINQGMASNLETTGDTYPSPTLKVNPSDTLVIRIINELENLSLPGSSTMSFPTNLHTHGLEISPLGNSDNIILSVAPGMQNVFEFHVPSTHEEGTFWYHPHRHEFTHEQVYRGLAGLLIIGRANSGIDQVADFPTRLMVLQNQDIRENPSSGRFELFPFSFTSPGAQWTINGQYMADLPMTNTQEVWATLEVDPVSLIRTFIPPAEQPIADWHFEDPNNQKVHFIAQDGSAFPLSVNKGRTALAPGKRVAEVVAAPPSGTTRIFGMTALLPQLTKPNPALTQPLLNVLGFGAGGNPSDFSNIPLTSATSDYVDLSQLPVDVSRIVTFRTDFTNNQPAFLINEEVFPNPPLFRPRLNTVEEWTLINQDSFFLPHPLHIHLEHFQGQVNHGLLFEPPHRYDQDVWYIEQSEEPPLLPTKIRTHFEKITGLTVYHCHNLDHEDHGMMGLLDVIPEMPIYAVGASAGGGPAVQVYNQLNSQLLASFFAFEEDFLGGVSLAVADVNNDTFSDIIVGAGPSGGPRVRVFDGATQFQTVLFDFFAFAEDFRGGVSVAGADFNADGFADIAAGALAGGGPNVRVFDGRTGAMISSFFAYDSAFRGGVSLAAGDPGGSGLPSLITGPGPGGGSHVKIWSNSLITQIGSALIFPGTSQVNFQTRGEFFAYETDYLGGIQVALGYNGGMSRGGYHRIITGTLSQGPRVTVWQAFTDHSGMENPSSMLDMKMVNTFFAFDPAQANGVRVGSVANSTGSDFIAGSGTGEASVLRRFAFGPGMETPVFLEEITPFTSGFLGGLEIAGTL